MATPSLLPNPRIINAHEHILGPRVLEKYRTACESVGIETTVFVGSSRYTLYAANNGFVEHHVNNEFLCELARREKGRVLAWVTFNPETDAMVEQLKYYLAGGATGVKLYLGHSGTLGDGTKFHCMNLDDPRMIPLYDYCQANCVPILLHVNVPYYRAEFDRVLSRYPNLPFVIPHLMMMISDLDGLSRILDLYPAVMTDLSFGILPYEFSGLTNISNHRDRVREFVLKEQDRILFGTDAVITGADYKSQEYLTKCFTAYRYMLELDQYVFDVTGKEGRKYAELNGLALPEEVVRKIYRGNFERFIKNTSISRQSESNPSSGNKP